jgi:hypothetical protein
MDARFGINPYRFPHMGKPAEFVQQKVFSFFFAGCLLISGFYLLPLFCGESWMDAVGSNL